MSAGDTPVFRGNFEDGDLAYYETTTRSFVPYPWASFMAAVADLLSYIFQAPGSAVLSGFAPPVDESTGVDGDIYIDNSTGDVYGPKADDAWGASVGNFGWNRTAD